MRPIQVHLLDACARSGLDFRSAARAIGVGAGTFVRWAMGEAWPQARYEPAIARFLREAGVDVTGPLTGRRARSGARQAVLPADELRALRKKAGLTIEKAARLAGVSPDQLGRAERGISVNAAARERLAVILRTGYPCCGEGPLKGDPSPVPAPAESVKSGQTEVQARKPGPVSSPEALRERRLQAGLSPTEAARLARVSLYELWAGERGLSVYPHVRDRLEAIIRGGYPVSGPEKKAG
jgi:transcriptional regulator with XRE-family HTH domain